jgi:hypothetical protein
MTGEEVLKREPIRLASDAGEFAIYPPGFKDRKPESYVPSKEGFSDLEMKAARLDSQLWNADTVWVDATVELDPSLSNEQVTGGLEADIQNDVYRFLRLLRRKLPETPIPMPTALSRSVTFVQHAPQPGWQLLAEIGPLTIKVVPREAGLTAERWEELRDELTSGADTELWEDFLLDTKVALDEGDLIRATLYAAITCESFIKQYTKQVATKVGLSKKFFNYLDSREPEIRAVRYYGPVLHLITGHSLEDENKELYRALEQLFKERNSIMHKGKRSFSEGESSKLKDNISRVEQAVSWVRNLPSKEQT